MNPSERKKVFFTSDWHIGHANVIVYDGRPFKDLDHMHRVLINNYNSAVDDDSVCYFIGDMGITQQSQVQKIISQLNGTKVLILGNHDKNTYSMYNAGFDLVLNTATIYIGQNRISMAHCPLPGIFREDVTKQERFNASENWHGELKPKNKPFISQDLTVDYHLHGHIHSDGIVKDRYTDRQFDVGVRANKYRPVSISEIESWISLSSKNGRGRTEGSGQQSQS